MPLSPGPRWSGAVPPPDLLADQRSQTPGSSAIESAANRPPGRADVMALDADGWGSYAPRGGATDPALDRARPPEAARSTHAKQRGAHFCRSVTVPPGRSTELTRSTRIAPNP